MTTTWPLDLPTLSAWYGMRCRDNRGDPKPRSDACFPAAIVGGPPLTWSLGTVVANSRRTVLRQ